MAARASFSMAAISSVVRFRRTLVDGLPFSCLVSIASSTSTDAVMRRTRPAGFKTWRVLLLTAKVELSDFELWLSIDENTLGLGATVPAGAVAAPGAVGGTIGVTAALLPGTLLVTPG